jgi:tetratricopeptide (TPR) repeat protein
LFSHYPMLNMRKIFLFLLLFIQMQTLQAQVTATEWFFKGKSLGDAQRFDEAIQCFDMAIKLSPDFAGAYNNRGTAKSFLGRHEEAVTDFLKSSELGVPLTCVNFYNLGRSLEELGRCSEAIEAYFKCKEQIGLKISDFDIDINEAINRVKGLCRA